MPQDECYLEVGTLEGRTLDAAAVGNESKKMYGVDRCDKYDTIPEPFPSNVRFVRTDIGTFLKDYPLVEPIGLCFYDADHSAEATQAFFKQVTPHLAWEAVVVLDDWDRETVRKGAFAAEGFYVSNDGKGRTEKYRWQMLREMPEYGNGLDCPQNHFGYSFGVSIWAFRRE
jgi:hypothetical protein